MEVGDSWYIRILQRNRTEIGYIERYIRDLLWKLAHIIMEARNPTICNLQAGEPGK